MDDMDKEYWSTYVPSKVLSKFAENDLENMIIIDLHNINSARGHVLDVADTVRLKRDIDFFEVDQVFKFSRIIYSAKRDTALVNIGNSQSGLAGFSMIYYLHRAHGGDWQIIDGYEGAMW